MDKLLVITCMLFVFVMTLTILLLQVQLKIKAFEKQNPLVDNKLVHDFVYTKTGKTIGRVFNIWAILNVTDAPGGEFEFLVKYGYGSAKALYGLLQTGPRTVMLLQQALKIEYLQNTDYNNELYSLYKLQRLNDTTLDGFEKIQFGQLAHLHIFIQ